MRVFIVLLVFLSVSVSNAQNSCQTPNLHENYVLAVNWQPGFCKLRARHPECDELSKNVLISNNFALHGLWPNKDGCGKEYGFCDSRVTHSAPMCTFPGFALNEKVSQLLRDFMPSVRFDSCLDRHEWWKHGTCTNMTPDEYFQVSLMMLEEFNRSSFVSFVQRNIGETVPKEALLAMFDVSFGRNTRKRVTLKCRNGGLEEIRIMLPRDINVSALKVLIARAREAQDLGNCGKNVTIVSAQKAFL